MMKELTLEELGEVTGGWTIGWIRRIKLGLDTELRMLLNESLKEIQNAICNNDEERRFVKHVYDSFDYVDR